MRSDAILLAGLLSLISSSAAARLHQHSERTADLSLDPSYAFDYDVATLGDVDYSDIDIDNLSANETDISDIEVVWGPSSPALEDVDTEEDGELELVRRQVLTRSQRCARGVHVIASGGNGAGDPHRYGNIQTLVYNITSKIPGSDSVSLPYNKGSSHGIQMTQNGVSQKTRWAQPAQDK